MSSLDIRPTDLLICIDETGDDTLRDPIHPLFGFGGCAITGNDLLTHLEEPWRIIKRKHFKSDRPLHATEIDLQNIDGINAIARFFSDSPIARFATILNTSTQLSGDSIDTKDAIKHAFSRQLGNLVRHYSFMRLILAFEHSDKGNASVREQYSDLRPLLLGPDGPFPAEIERCFIPKSVMFPAMEVADFIMHAAGGEARRGLKSRKGALRRDFEVVFSPSPERFSDFLLLTHVNLKQVPAKRILI